LLETFTIVLEIITLVILIQAIGRLYYFYDFKATTNYYGMLFTMASYLMLILGRFVTFSGGYKSYSKENMKILIVSLMLHYFILGLLYSIIFIKNRGFRIIFFTIPVLIIIRALVFQNNLVFIQSAVILNGIFFIINKEFNLLLSHLIYLVFFMFLFKTGMNFIQPYIFIWSISSLLGNYFLVRGFSDILYSNERWEK
jgi:hypothetical protein